MASNCIPLIYMMELHIHVLILRLVQLFSVSNKAPEVTHSQFIFYYDTRYHVDDLVQDCSNCTAYALELL